MPNFQGRSSRVGKNFQELCGQGLEGAGFDVRPSLHIKELGVEVDFVADNKEDVSFFVECKGSMNGKRPGTSRTDTMKKALCNGFLIEKEGLAPYLILSSHLPKKSSSAGRMLQAAGRDVVFDVILPFDKTDMRRLEMFCAMDTEELEAWKRENPTFHLPE